MNIAIFLRTPILKNICEWLLLLGVVFVLRNWRKFKVLWNFDDFFSIFLRTLEAIVLNQASCKSHSSTICLNWVKRNDYYDVIISEYLQCSKIVDGETKNINIGENQIKKCITILGNSFWSIFFFDWVVSNLCYKIYVIESFLKSFQILQYWHCTKNEVFNKGFLQ